jgi:hypothetical protein
MQSAKSRISKAISIGAPAYNAGDIDECARVYQETALEIIDSKVLPASLQSNLEDALTTAKAGQENSKDIAWAFRGQFDTIMEYQEPFTPSSSADKTKYTLEPFTDRMLPNEPVIVNDNVMGGMSRGMWDATESTFRGSTSLANNGGFASLRWRMKTLQNWSYANGIYMKVSHSQPSQHTFRILVKDDLCQQVRGANYKTVFSNPDDDDDKEAVIYVPFTAFDQMEQMGRQLQAPPFNRGAVTEIGIMAIKPTVVGDFELTIKEWGLYV